MRSLPLSLLLLASPAWALNQSAHYDITVQSCRAAGMPTAFCTRLGADVYNVDSREFNDLAAHSQVPVGSTTCAAANTSIWRVFWLGGQIRGATQAIGYQPSRSGHDALAHVLGRALHTVQDNCAHSGMPNPQHAWHSLSDVCQGTSESPDIVPAAAVCARTETDAVLSAFIDVLHDNGGDFAQLADVTGDADKHWPAYTDVCNFLGSASEWGGDDGRWDNDVVRPALKEQLVLGLNGADNSRYTRVCDDGADDLRLWYSDSLDTSDGPQSCLKIHAFCLGKADSVDGEAPPYEPAPMPAATASGCQVGGPTPSSTPPLLLGLVLLALAVRRRVTHRA